MGFLDSIVKPLPQNPPSLEVPVDNIEGPLPPMIDQYYDALGGSSLPPPSSYGAVQPSFNEKIAELAIGTSIKIGGEAVKSIDELPTLFYFLTDNWRHFQLSNLKKADQRDIERRIKYIHMLSGRGKMHNICKLKQIELLNKIYLFKSRSDLDDMRERKIWTLQTQQMNQQEIKRPKEGSGGFLSFFTNRNKGEY